MFVCDCEFGYFLVGCDFGLVYFDIFGFGFVGVSIWLIKLEFVLVR